MLIYSFITDYQAFNLRHKDNTTRDKNETKVGKQSANLGKNNEPIQNRLLFLIDCKSVILHHLTILSFPMVRPAWGNWWLIFESLDADTRIAYSDAIGRNIFHDNTSCSDGAAFTNCHSGKNSHIAAYPAVSAYGHRLGPFLPRVALLRVRAVAGQAV